MSEDKWIRTTVRFPLLLHASLKREAGDQGRSIEDLVRSAVERELSGPVQGRFGESPRGNERRLLRELEKGLHDYLDKIRATLVTPESSGHEFLMRIADRFIDCCPAPILIRGKSEAWSWKNPSFSDTFDATDEQHNLTEIDKLHAGGHDNFCVVHLKAKEIDDVSEEDIPFDSWQFTFWDDDDRAYTGDLLLPHAAVERAIRGQSVLMPLSPRKLDHKQLNPDADKALMARLARFLEHLPASIAIKDVAGRYQWANNFMLDNVARKKLHEIIGKKPGEVLEVSGATSVDEQEELVKEKKTGLLAAASVSSRVSRAGLRFPVLDDAEQRIMCLGTVGTGPPGPIKHKTS